MAIRSIQRGTANVASGTTSVNVTIASVNLAQAYVNITGMRSSVDAGIGEWRRQQPSATLNTSTNIAFTIAVSPSANDIIIDWEVIEDDSLSVQAGTSTAVNTVDIAISTVDLNKTFAIVWVSGDATGGLQSGFHRARLTTSTNLQLANNFSNFGGIRSWYVVQGNNQRVQQIEGTIGSSGTSNDVSISTIASNHSVLRGRSFAQGSNENDPDERSLFAIISPTAFRFTRQVAPAYSSDYTMFVVEDFNFQVQRGSISFGASSSVTATITQLNPSKSMLIQGQSYGPGYSANYGGGGAVNANADLPSQFLNTPTSISFQRARATNVNLVANWEVAQELLARKSNFFLAF